MAKIGPSTVITDTEVVCIRRTLTPQNNRFSSASLVASRSTNYNTRYRFGVILTSISTRSRAESNVTMVKPTRANGIGRTRPKYSRVRIVRREQVMSVFRVAFMFNFIELFRALVKSGSINIAFISIFIAILTCRWEGWPLNIY